MLPKHRGGSARRQRRSLSTCAHGTLSTLPTSVRESMGACSAAYWAGAEYDNIRHSGLGSGRPDRRRTWNGIHPHCVRLQHATRLKTVLAEKNWKGIVHLWSLDAPPTSEMNAATLESAQRMVCGSALDLVQALAGSAAALPPRLWLVTRGARSTSRTQEKIEIVTAMLGGMANAITEEHPEWSCRGVDLEPADSNADSTADARLL